MFTAWSKLLFWRKRQREEKEEQQTPTLIQIFKKRECKLIRKQRMISEKIFGNANTQMKPKDSNDTENEEIAILSDGSTGDHEKKNVSKEDFDHFKCTRWKNLLFLSRTLWCGHSLWIQWMYEWILK